VTGRFMNEFWGKVHFGLSFIFMNALFLPMFFQGMAGMSRRMYDGGLTYAEVPATAKSPGIPGLSSFIIGLNSPIFVAAVCLGLSQIPFIINFFWSIHHGQKTESDNPWDATTLDWQTPTPPPHGNFTRTMVVYRGPYEYSVPGEERDFTTQNQPDQPQPATHGHSVRS
jgi:cytochrome c oxidase subunit 1